MSFFIDNRELYFSIWPRDIIHLMLKFVQKNVFNDSRQNEFVVVNRGRYIKYYHSMQLKWCVAHTLNIVDVIIWGDAIVLVSEKYKAVFLDKKTGRSRLIVNVKKVKPPLVIHNSHLVQNATHRWTY